MNGWIIVQTFTVPQDAYMAKSWLESANIEVFLQDELTAQVNNFYSNAIGGVKILVKESDAEEAVKLLTEVGFLKVSGEEESESWVWVKGVKDRTHCPFCHSDSIAKRKDLRIEAVVLYFILGVLFPFFRPVYTCYDCDKNWKYKNKV